MAIPQYQVFYDNPQKNCMSKALIELGFTKKAVNAHYNKYKQFDSVNMNKFCENNKTIIEAVDFTDTTIYKWGTSKYAKPKRLLISDYEHVIPLKSVQVKEAPKEDNIQGYIKTGARTQLITNDGIIQVVDDESEALSNEYDLFRKIYKSIPQFSNSTNCQRSIVGAIKESCIFLNPIILTSTPDNYYNLDLFSAYRNATKDQYYRGTIVPNVCVPIEDLKYTNKDIPELIKQHTVFFAIVEIQENNDDILNLMNVLQPNVYTLSSSLLEKHYKSLKFNITHLIITKSTIHDPTTFLNGSKYYREIIGRASCVQEKKSIQLKCKKEYAQMLANHNDVISWLDVNSKRYIHMDLESKDYNNSLVSHASIILSCHFNRLYDIVKHVNNTNEIYAITLDSVLYKGPKLSDTETARFKESEQKVNLSNASSSMWDPTRCSSRYAQHYIKLHEDITDKYIIGDIRNSILKHQNMVYLGPGGSGKSHTARELSNWFITSYYYAHSSILSSDNQSFSFASTYSQLPTDMVKAKYSPIGMIMLDETTTVDKEILDIYLSMMNKSYVIVAGDFRPDFKTTYQAKPVYSKCMTHNIKLIPDGHKINKDICECKLQTGQVWKPNNKYDIIKFTYIHRFKKDHHGNQPLKTLVDKIRKNINNDVDYNDKELSKIMNLIPSGKPNPREKGVILTNTNDRVIYHNNKDNIIRYRFTKTRKYNNEQVYNGTIIYSDTQPPSTRKAFSDTIFSNQGLTITDPIYIDIYNMYGWQMLYTALSRAKDKKQIYKLN
jgi:hypothetical protein